jgi:hypothetical protein
MNMSRSSTVLVVAVFLPSSSSISPVSALPPAPVDRALCGGSFSWLRSYSPACAGISPQDQADVCAVAAVLSDNSPR